MKKTPLECWIAGKIAGYSEADLTLDAIRQYQLLRLKETIEYARAKSPFYRRQLADFDPGILENLKDIATLPFTAPEQLVQEGPLFLCVSQSDIERVVTLPVPGMPDRLRRIMFTSEDVELTTDFFHHGMSTLVQPSQKVLILMPGDLPASVGDLLVKALPRMGVEGIVHGIVQDPADAIADILRFDIDSLVGIPAQVLSIARHPRVQAIPPGQIKSILLSADYVPSGIVGELERVWDAPVFNHYGTTEMGFGGGVQCDALSGYHLREADLYFEIVDPDSGKPQPGGIPGEIVFTTLTRSGMPLIRFRTGDLASWIPEACPCGTVLPAMGKVRGRITEMARLRTGDWLNIPDLDEVLFPLSGIVNYSAALIKGDDFDRLEIVVYPGTERPRIRNDSVESALLAVPAIASAVSAGSLSLEPLSFTTENWVTSGVAKRGISQVVAKGTR